MDKNKIFQTATRLAQKGQLDRAIAEYERLLEHDPNEVRALLKIGELRQRKGENEQAARALERAAELYSNQGFFLKAVAVYKQILKLDPRVEAHQRLAELYQQLGLLREAMSQLQIVIATYEREGRTQDTIAVLRRMLDLEPENALARARLGELLLGAGQADEGKEELRRALEQLEKEGRSDDYVRVAERLLSGEEPDPEIARKAARIYLDRGEARRALARLQPAFKADPTSVETLSLLARAFQDVGDVKKTVSVYKELARLHREAGRAREEREAWKQVLRLAPDDAQARDALGRGAGGPAQPPPLRRTEPPQVADDAIPVPDSRGAPPPREPTPARPPSQQTPGQARPAEGSPAAARLEDVPRLLAELDVYLKYRLYPKAKDHLAALLALDPQRLEVQERAAQLAEGTGDREGLRAALIQVVKLARQAKEEERAQKALSRLATEFPGDPEVAALGSAEPVSVSEMIVVDDGTAAADEEVVMAVSLDDEPLDLGSADLAASGAGAEDEDSALRAALEISILEGAEETFDEPLLDEPPEPEIAPPAASRAAEPASPAAMAKAAVSARESAPASSAKAARPASRAAPASPAKTAKPASMAAPSSDPALQSDLDELDFYWQQEMFDEAEELLRSILARAPGHPVATARLAELEARRRSAAAPASTPPAAAPPAPAAAEEAKKRPPPPAFAKSLTVVPDEEASFDLAGELLADLDLEESPAEEPLDFQYSVEEVLAEFKKGVSQTVRPEDSETHYNLGIAYKEMGLFQEAIEAFQQAMLGCKGTRREVDCMITAGLCKADLGDHRGAIEWYLAGLGAAGVTPESALALHYEIGVSYEALGERDKALEHYTKVYRTNPNYREVAAAIGRLRKGEDNATRPSPVNKGKVGYV